MQTCGVSGRPAQQLGGTGIPFHHLPCFVHQHHRIQRMVHHGLQLRSPCPDLLDGLCQGVGALLYGLFQPFVDLAHSGLCRVQLFQGLLKTLYRSRHATQLIGAVQSRQANRSVTAGQLVQ